MIYLKKIKIIFPLIVMFIISLLSIYSEKIYTNHPLDKHEILLVQKALKDRESEV